MKKSLLTIAFAVTGLLSANAQVAKAPVAKKNAVQTVSPVAKKMDNTIQQTIVSSQEKVCKVQKSLARKAPMKAEASFSPSYNVYNAFYDAIYPDGWYSYKNYMLPALTDVTFDVYGLRNVANPEITWKLETQGGTDVSSNMGQDEYGNGTFHGWGYYMVPELTVTSNGETASYYDYFDYNGTNRQAYIQAGCDSLINISNCSPGGNISLGFSDLPNTFAINQPFYETGKKLVSLAQYYAAPSNQIYAEGIYAALYCSTASAESPLEGKTLTATIYTFDEEGNMLPYASAEASDADAIVQSSGVLYVSFKFIESDDILGDVEAPITLPQEDFIVVIDGIDALSKSYIAPFGTADGFTGFGYAILEDGTISSVYYSNVDTPQVNLHIGFENAALPVAELADPDLVVEFPAEGGVGVTSTDGGESYNDIDIYTEFAADTWNVVDAPEWVTNFSIDDQYLQQYGIMVFYAEAEALPAGTEGRSGEIVLGTSFNKEVVVKVKQGVVADAIDNVQISGNVKLNDGVVFNLAGQQVNKDYKGIVIKNGKKLILK